MEGVISGSNIFRLLARTYVETEGKNRVAACRGQKHPLLPFTCFHEAEEKSGCQIEEIRILCRRSDLGCDEDFKWGRQPGKY